MLCEHIRALLCEKDWLDQNLFDFLTSQIRFFYAGGDISWICHFKECEVGLHRNRWFDLHTREEAG